MNAQRNTHSNPATDPYRTDLAYVHDAGFTSLAAAAAQSLVKLLGEQKLSDGRVVELGCGSGVLAADLMRFGYGVTGFDISPAMIALSKARVPRGDFRCASFLDAELPPCVAVVAVGEIFNYLFDRRNSLARLIRFFARVERALIPRGVFMFDVALTGRVPEGSRRGFTEGRDWACLYEAVEDRPKQTLTRTITTFRRNGQEYRRDHEVHQLRLYTRNELVPALKELGFRVQTLKKYGQLEFPPGYLSFVATKP